MKSIEKIPEYLRYDPETGEFIRLTTRGGYMAGTVAGCRNADGYTLIQVDGKQFMAHRLAILDQTGTWPTEDVDHINGDRSDNRIANLRVVSRSVNMQNLKRSHKDNTTGFLGVVPNHAQFAAQIRIDGKNVHLGNFNTPEEAHEAYLIAKRAIHVGCAI